MIAILYREELKEYDFGAWHSFRGDRYETFPRLLQTHLIGRNGIIGLWRRRGL